MILNHDVWKPSWIRGGHLEEIVWISKNILAWCLGVHIVFFDINEKKMNLRWCWHSETGDGARCLSAHIRFPVFAFSEKIIQPRILVLAYPSMTKISECVAGCPSGYLATAFTTHDHLVSVGFYPNFPMIIWNWRTGERITSVNTHIRDEVGQMLRITQIGPTVVGQLGKHCGKMYTWEVKMAENVAIFKDYEVKLPKQQKILWMDWCPTSREPLLAVTDIEGHIFLCNYDGTNMHRIVLSQRCFLCTDIDLPIVLWFRGGIVLRTSFCQIRYYTKNPRKDTWQREWYVKSMSKPYILITHPSNNHRFFYHTMDGHFMQIDFPEEDTNPRVTKYLDYGAVYKFVDFVHPWCHHLAVTDDLKELYILECYSGTIVATLDPEIDGEIACQVSHPDYPLIVLGTTQGEVIFVSLPNPVMPRIVASTRLQREPLDLIKFSYSGRFLIAAEKSSGNCYCINLHREKVYTVQTLIRVKRSIADLLLYESNRKLRVLVLFVSVPSYNVGQQLQLFDVSENENLVTESVNVLDLSGIYRAIFYTPGNPTSFLGSPYLTRQLRVQKVDDFKNVATMDGLVTGHKVKLANVFADRTWITTAALDGLIFVRDKTVRHVHACIMTHHRSTFGSMKAMVSKNGDWIVCLGYNGTLAAFRSSHGDHKKSASTSGDQSLYHVDYNQYERHKKKIFSDYASLDSTVQDLLNRSKSVFPRKEDDTTWSEWRENMQILEETIKFKEVKAQILHDFKILKGKVKKLLDDNEICPEIEKLPVSSFDLDKTGRDQRLKAGRDECEDLRLNLEHDIGEMKRVTEWIRKTFWDPQVILGTSLVAIFGSERVTNYASISEELQTKDHFKWASFYKEILSMIVEDETFRPWKLYDKEELEVELSKRLKLKRDEETRIDLLFEQEEEDEEVGKEDLAQETAMEGTTTHKFIESAPYYSQLECYGFYQITVNNRFLSYDCEKLRIYFNQMFDAMYEKKEREMNVIRDRIERIRYIDSELRTMFGQRVPRVPTKPEWHLEEKPESIIKVLEHEVKAKPYISPSLQEILDKQAAEEERIRQLLLADDFRERALMAMMDGVLEVRWEDTIKIDIPKPAFMLQKKPDDYTLEEIQVAKQYEKDVQFLQEERERYKRMLEAEYVKVIDLLRHGIDKFNEKLNELFQLKMMVEAAINQLNLRYVRGCMQIYHKAKGLQQEEQLKMEMKEKRAYEDVLKSDLQAFQNVRQQLMSTQQVLSYKEKILARKFKSEFSTLSKLNLELLNRQYKRRPKTHLKNLSFSEFARLGKHVAMKTRPSFLPSECNEYVNALDQLDVRPATLPPTIESLHWDQLVRLRRQKINSELKMRSKQVHILDTESLILGLEQKIEKNRLEMEEMKKNIEESRLRFKVSGLDLEIQLVLKMGQLEVDANGDLSDTETAILVSQGEIEAVNELIRAAGNCKLKALSRLMNFQRGTLMKQWEHECERARIEDLQDDLRFVESITVTKEMQAYLKRMARGLRDDKTPQHLSKYIAAMKRRFQKILDDQLDRLHALETKIEQTRIKNTQLDQQIMKMNVARCEMEQSRDLIGEIKHQEHADRKLRMIMRRATLIKKLQDNYGNLLELQTEHELLRLRRYPTLDFKILDDQEEPTDDIPSRYDFCPC